MQIIFGITITNLLNDSDRSMQHFLCLRAVSLLIESHCFDFVNSFYLHQLNHYEESLVIVEKLDILCAFDQNNK